MAQGSANRSAAHKSRRRQQPEAPGALTRAVAAQVLEQVLGQGRSLTAALAADPSQQRSDIARLDSRDLPLLHELCYGVLRTLPRLDALIQRLLQRPLKPRDQDLLCLLRVGLYQLDALALPDHAAVAATVAAAGALDKPWATGLINASLRRFIREQDELDAQVRADPNTATLFPPWLLTRIQAAWPDHWAALIAASNARAPMFLRVNRRRIAPADYLARLRDQDIAATPFGQPACADDCGLLLQTPTPISRLPGYAEGLVSVQDAGAQCAAKLLDARPGQRVLDACAAPGGKTAHLLELADNRLALTALDKDPDRLRTLTANLTRLGLDARALVADAGQPGGDWASQRYDRILLDAPCSGTGVIRRHPDIKWLRRDQDVAKLASTQTNLLAALWPLLAEDGILLYVTCSVLPEENQEQIARFLASAPNARELPIEADWGLARTHGCQLLPTPHGSDGFFFARLTNA